MRRSAVGIAFALSLASTVSANAYGPPFSWTGLYVGVNGGYSWGRADLGVSGTVVVDDFPIEGTVSDRANVNGWLGGGQIGYNVQSKGWVFGVEADFQWTGQDGEVSGCFDLVCAKASYDLDWFGTVRGRVGYLVFPDTLLYATGGLAYGRVNADFSVSHPTLGTISVSDSATKTGWVVGGGLEWALDRSWRVRAEYLYMDLGTMRTELGPVSVTIPNGEFPINVSATGTARTDFTDQIVRVGLSYKFGEAYTPLK